MTVVRPLARSAALIGGMTLAGLAASPAFAATNLIGDGSFEAFSAGASGKTTIAPGGEAGTIAPWTVTGDSVDLYAASKLAPQDGTQSVDLDGNAPGGVSQAVTTTAGTTYTATFLLRRQPQ